PLGRGWPALPDRVGRQVLDRPLEDRPGQDLLEQRRGVAGGGPAGLGDDPLDLGRGDLAGGGPQAPASSPSAGPLTRPPRPAPPPPRSPLPRPPRSGPVPPDGTRCVPAARRARGRGGAPRRRGTGRRATTRCPSARPCP